MKIVFILLAALSFVPVGRGESLAQPPTEEEAAAQMARLQTVGLEFFRLSDGDKPALTWKASGGKYEQNILPVVSGLLKDDDFAPIRPFIKNPEDYCVVNVCVAKDPKQQPVYLYLFSYQAKENTAKLVVAFHVQKGKAVRIKG